MRFFVFVLLFVCGFVFAQNPPLNLQALSARDSASFETYSKRAALVQDSIAAMRGAMESARARTLSFMQPLEPKSEFEKQAEFDARQRKWNAEFDSRLEKDTRSISHRLAELEKAKARIQENQTSLYGFVEVKSVPPAAQVWVGMEEIGATPAEYGLLVPGNAKVILRKEGFNQWDTVLAVVPGARFRLSVVLDEKSIFSQENEIDFGKLLSKDTSIQGYMDRIKVVRARKAEVAKEIKLILEDFPNVYPALEPQKAGEAAEAFSKRHEAWMREGLRQYNDLERRSQLYNGRLDRSVKVLNDFVLEAQNSFASAAAPAAKVELGAYDAEKEVFELSAQDLESEKSPFVFKGKVSVPLGSAKAIDRASPGFAASVHFLNYPFEADSVSVYLAMSRLQLSMAGKDLKVEGSFGAVDKYKSMEGYVPWRMRADSILSGQLKPQGLDYNYAMGRAAAKDAAADAGASSGSPILGWRGWARVAAYSLAAGCAGTALYKNSKAGEHKDKASKIKSKIEMLDKSIDNAVIYRELNKEREYHKDRLESNESQRLIYSIGAGAFAIAGTATFFF